jgi:hypothetical protein
MKSIISIALSLLVITSLLAPLKADARCNDTKSLDACYADCQRFFPDPLLRSSCYAGCVIGCYIYSRD